MTAAELLERGRVLARRWWALPALLVVVAVLLTWRLEEGRVAQAEAARLAQEARLRAEGLLVVEQAKAKGLEAEAERLAGQNAELAAELERARAAAPGAKVSGTISARTGPRPASGEPRPGPAFYRCEPGPAGPAAPPAEEPPACLLAEGDLGEVVVNQVELETKDGARVVAGAAQAWRTHPWPPTRLFGGGFQAQLSAAKGEQERAAPGWGAGVWLGVGREGWAAGPAVAVPPVRLGPVQLELVVGAGLGSGGVWQGGASGIVRW